MSEGYPDYARVSRAGQFQLFNGASVTPAVGTPFFRGYVGLFPFINFTTNMAGSVDFAQIAFTWYPDNTFTNPIGFRVANRTGNSFAVTQYANLSDWLTIFYTTKSGNPMTFLELSVYGTQQPAEPRQLMSHDTAMFSFAGNIAASTTLTQAVTKIIPGKSLVNVFAGATSWFINFNYYDFGTNAYQNYYAATHNSFTDSSLHIELAVLDTPLQIQVANQDAAPRQFGVLWDVM